MTCDSIGPMESRFYLETRCSEGKMVKGKCALGGGSGPSLQESVSVLVSMHNYVFVSVYWQRCDMYTQISLAQLTIK